MQLSNSRDTVEDWIRYLRSTGKPRKLAQPLLTEKRNLRDKVLVLYNMPLEAAENILGLEYVPADDDPGLCTSISLPWNA